VKWTSTELGKWLFPGGELNKSSRRYSKQKRSGQRHALLRGRSVIADISGVICWPAEWRPADCRSRFNFRSRGGRGVCGRAWSASGVGPPDIRYWREGSSTHSWSAAGGDVRSESF